MRAALAVARAILTGDDPAAHDAAASGTCPTCTTVAAMSFGFIARPPCWPASAAVRVRAGPRAMLAAVDAAEAELRAAP